MQSAGLRRPVYSFAGIPRVLHLARGQQTSGRSGMRSHCERTNEESMSTVIRRVTNALVSRLLENDVKRERERENDTNDGKSSGLEDNRYLWSKRSST